MCRGVLSSKFCMCGDRRESSAVGGDEMLSILGMRTFASTGAPELIKSCSTAPLSHSAARCAGVSSWSRSAAEEIACAFPVRAAWTRMTDTHGVKLTH